MTTEKKSPDSLEKIETSMTKIEAFIEKNKKIFFYIIGALIVIIGGISIYKNLVQAPRERKAQELIWRAQHQFAIDSFAVALNGNETVIGFAEIADEYSHTPTGNLAKFYAGISSLRIGEYEQAIKYLEKYDSDDEITSALAIGAIGDANSELGNLEKAADLYLKASKTINHEAVSPRFLMKAGGLYEKLGKNDKALAAYNEIKNKFSSSPEAEQIDKFIIRVQQ
ncbi:MAG: tetratricopeptide repeat protein [Bacteroidales bacterium]|jgi:tetratricopeptide (TPR) repeat protein|nr:tetratricopeptide repeat protein [Bacteroidales bacterium]